MLCLGLFGYKLALTCGWVVIMLNLIIIVGSIVFLARLGPRDRWDLGQADPLQWICRKRIQELGFDETAACLESGDGWVGIKNIGVDGLTVRGNEPLARWHELPSGLIRQRHEGGTWVLSFFPPPSPRRRSLSLYHFSSIHPYLTSVSHPCPHLSACPISRSLWRSVSCCDPDSTV